jgi:drug/metabolite transporter (DMT)-like permease
MSTSTVPVPNPATRALDPLAASLVVLLCLSWGFNQVAVKLAFPDFPPFLQGALRSIAAAVIVAAYARARGIPLFERDGTLKAGLAVGALFGAEFLFLYQGLAWTTATRAVLFLYLAPFFVVLGARIFLPADRFSPRQWLGLALSFAGMVVAFGVPTPAVDPRQFTGDVLTVIGAALWAATTLTIKASPLSKAVAEKTLLYQLVGSAPMFIIAALVSGERITAMPSAVALGAMAYQAVWVVSLTYTIWFALIARYSATRLSAFTFLTPLFGVVAGHVMLHDPLTPAFVGAVALVAAGLVLVNRAKAPAS